MKTPSEVNQREKGALILRVVVLEGVLRDVVVTVSWYVGSNFAAWVEIVIWTGLLGYV